MLVLTRKNGEVIKIGERIAITVRIKRGKVSLAIDAPKEVNVVRGELEPPPAREAA